jgi:hypothetical protein
MLAARSYKQELVLVVSNAAFLPLNAQPYLHMKELGMAHFMVMSSDRGNCTEVGGWLGGWVGGWVGGREGRWELGQICCGRQEQRMQQLHRHPLGTMHTSICSTHILLNVLADGGTPINRPSDCVCPLLVCQPLVLHLHTYTICIRGVMYV